eukprot:2416869-Pyramimonas_sp.AAC.1
MRRRRTTVKPRLINDVGINPPSSSLFKAPTKADLGNCCSGKLPLEDHDTCQNPILGTPGST